jgi:uncharacterized protein (TIGR03067 family)
MKRLGLLALAVIAVSLWVRDVPASCFLQDDAARQFKGSLQGRWQMISRNENGTPSDAALINNRSITFVGDKYLVKDGEKVIAEPNFTVDLTKTPAWVEVTHSTGDSASGIIKLEGDILTICVGLGSPRPNEFKSEPGDARLLMAFKRVKT